MSFDIPQLAEITIDDLEALGTGAGILGTGGGGNPRIGRLRLQTLFEDEEYPDSVKLVSPKDLPADATVASVGGMGAPTISVEKFPKGDEDYKSLRAIESFSGETVDAIIPGEIGGANSMAPLCVAAMADLPVVDGDGMGRAFPELQMDTFFIYGSPVNYAATTDERGNQVVYKDIDSAKRLEDLARAITVQMGGRSGYAFPLMTGEFISQYAIPHTVSLATELGRTVERAREQGDDPVKAGRELLGGKDLFEGKVVDVHRRNRDGFAMGSVTLSGLDDDSRLEIEFQNEFLIARADDDQVLTTVPDLICIVDNDTGAPVMTDALRYGQRVRVLGVPAPELLTTPEALDVIGPEAFGYELAYEPLPRGETGW
ncbi:DUF917 domain-containing protein [Haloferax profundi]|uniref:Hydantoinase n=1 Tax=Haloferax profundi TaxID=1544718 RepID=A0A0W1RFH4_9EURY|nr:DUF917 domain-containing protein [Haloferax profundi]KTG12203.1 hydantoinase [Haloferax profundi]